MKPITYTVTLSSNQTVPVVAHNAGEAIQQALLRCRGRTVIACAILKDGKSGGKIEFDVPKHEAVPLDPLPPKGATVKPKAKPAPVNPDSLFGDESAIVEESRNARRRFDAASIPQ